ncbi:unnamed protein product [Chrysodeixis includens]|uniref:Uncharacterized protein n=1 Tax=Chrysodeixis includens TaxID=689277 RepID=A0A9N8KYQ4_CHRIL|nr:unnamed protein product [Chrysodeixis includens]
MEVPLIVQLCFRYAARHRATARDVNTMIRREFPTTTICDILNGRYNKGTPLKPAASLRERRKNYDNVDNPLDKRRIRVDRNKNKLSANYCAVRFAEITPVSRRAGAAEPSVRPPPDVRG